MSIFISQNHLVAVCAGLLDGHVHYGFGAKASSLDVDPAAIGHIDCSGFIRYVTYRATDRHIKLQDGSWNHHAWCKAQKLSEVAYSTAALVDGWLRIAFIEPSKTHSGHVWFVLNGLTLESHGGKGPDRRPWNCRILASEVGDCYLFAQTYMLTMPTVLV